MTPLMQLRDVSVHFPARHGDGVVRAVNDVSLNIQEGDVLGLVGESGCGKSTLARAIVRLVRPTGGSIRFRDRDLASLSGRELRLARRDLQLVFQDPQASLNPRFNARRTLHEPLANFGLARGKAADQRAADLLDLVGLAPHYLDAYPHELSGGQRQRLAIARALAPEPRVLLCDEPVSALDVSIQAQIVNLIRDLRNRLNLTVLFISHDLSVVRHLADRVAVMYLGRLVELASGDAIFTAPKHPYTRALLQAVPIPDPPRERAKPRQLLAGDPPSVTDERVGCDFASRCPLADEYCRRQRPSLAGQAHQAACWQAE